MVGGHVIGKRCGCGALPPGPARPFPRHVRATRGFASRSLALTSSLDRLLAFARASLRSSVGLGIRLFGGVQLSGTSPTVPPRPSECFILTAAQLQCRPGTSWPKEADNFHRGERRMRRF